MNSVKKLKLTERKRVAIVASKRIPFVKSGTYYNKIALAELMTPVLNSLVEELHLKGKRLGEVALGALLKAPSERGLARECVLGTQLDPHTPALDIERACGTGLEAIMSVANKIALGQIECGIGGGVDTNSNLPLLFSHKLADVFKEFNKSGLSTKSLKTIATLKPKDFLPERYLVSHAHYSLKPSATCSFNIKSRCMRIKLCSQYTLTGQPSFGGSFQ
jgi:acetyl-CoA C-acetyltransferase